MIGIVDYGAGNLRSVKKALDHLMVESRIISNADSLHRIQKLILPGVGAFGAAMDRLQQLNLVDPILRWIDDDRPFLGICLGMQILFKSGEENPEINGIGAFAGSVPRFDHRRVPQIGWNRIYPQKDSSLFSGLPDDAFFYFLHGYYVDAADPQIVAATANYGITYPCAVQRGNVCAVQFHPEKSADNGLQLLQNWINS